jgi:hypothetical protein
MSGRDSSSKAEVKQQLRLSSAPLGLQRRVNDFAPISEMVLTEIVVVVPQIFSS